MNRSLLDRLFDWFMPSAIARGSDAWQRARMFLVSHLFGTPLGHVIMAGVYLIDPAPGLPYAILVGLITAFFAFPFLLRWTGRLNALSVASVLNLAAIVLLASYLYGGISSPFLPWMIAVPLNAMFYIGTEPRLRIAVLAALGGLLVLFFLAHQFGPPFPDRIPLETLAGPGLVSLFCAAAFVSMMALFYATTVSRQQAALEHEVAVRKATEARLRDSEANFRVLAETSNDMITRTRLSDGVRLYASPAARTLLGQAPEELNGTSVASTMHPDDWPAVRAAARALIAGADNRTVTYRGLHKDGSYRWFEATMRLIAEAPGELIAVARDITARRAIEEELLRAKMRAEQASRTKSDFLANMSHELRTPLNAIMGFSQLIRSQLVGPVGHPKYLEYSRDIYESGEHLLGLINEILDLAKLEAGRLELHEGDIPVRGLLDSCATMLLNAVNRAGLALVVEIDPAVGRIRADEKRLKQVLLNLLSNAVKFTERGGRITLGATLDGAGGCTITVTDTGIGIAAEHQALVLEPFGQVASALARNTEGTGLGLPLAARLVELHGGQLDLDSAPGRGTTVSIRLPQARVVARAA
jgi:PAS domain S-box-containing protein